MNSTAATAPGSVSSATYPTCRDGCAARCAGDSSPTDDMAMDDFTKSALGAVSVDGTVSGVPFRWNAGMGPP